MIYIGRGSIRGHHHNHLCAPSSPAWQFSSGGRPRTPDVRALRADALKVVVFRQTNNGGVWRDAQPSADTAHKLEDSILTRARELRLATLGQAG